MYAQTCGGLSQVTRPQPLRNLNSCMPLLVSSNLTSPPFLCQSTYNPFIGFVHGMYAVKIYIDSSISHQQAQSCGTGCHRNTRGAKRGSGRLHHGTSFIRSRTSKWENNFEDHRSKFERKAHVWAF